MVRTAEDRTEQRNRMEGRGRRRKATACSSAFDRADGGAGRASVITLCEYWYTVSRLHRLYAMYDSPNQTILISG